VKFFNVLSTQDVYKQMTKHVFKVQEVAQLPANLIRRLLHKFTWDSDKLLEAIFEDEKLTALNYELAPVTEQMDCEICFDTFKDPAKIEVFECNHRCCVDCLNGYLVSQISDGGLLNCICCPGFNCKYELDDEFVLQHLSEQIKIKYKQIITNSFVSSNKMLKWCPTANCTKAIEIKTGFLLGLNESVRCACANYFCFKCDASVPHDPLTCELFERWQEDAKDKLNDMKSEEWMKKFTKQCPKCRVSNKVTSIICHMPLTSHAS
jgi:ariadne-1